MADHTCRRAWRSDPKATVGSLELGTACPLLRVQVIVPRYVKAPVRIDNYRSRRHPVRHRTRTTPRRHVRVDCRRLGRFGHGVYLAIALSLGRNPPGLSGGDGEGSANDAGVPFRWAADRGLLFAPVFCFGWGEREFDDRVDGGDGEFSSAVGAFDELVEDRGGSEADCTPAFRAFGGIDLGSHRWYARHIVSHARPRWSTTDRDRARTSGTRSPREHWLCAGGRAAGRG